MKSILFQAASSLLKNRGLASILILIPIPIAFLSLTESALSAALINLLSNADIQQSNLYWLVSLFITIPVITYLAQWGLSQANLHLQVKSAHDFSALAIQKVMNLPGKYLESTDLTKQVHEINNDSCQIVMFLLNIFSNLIPQCLIFVIVLLILADISWYMVLLVLILNGLYIAVLFSKKKFLIDLKEEYMNCQSAYFSSLYQWIYGWSLCRRYSSQLAEQDALQSNQKMIKKAARQQNVSQLFSGLYLLVRLLPQILLLIIGGTRVWQGSLSLGWFMACLSYLGQFQSAVSSLTSWADQLQSVSASCRRISRYFSTDSIPFYADHHAESDEIQSIQLNKLCVSYEDNQVICSAEYRFISGQLTVLCGENGCGKSTLLKAIGGLIEEKTESIAFFDQDGKKSEKNRSSLCGYLLQNDFFLENHSPEENLLCPDPDPDLFNYLIQGFGLDKVLSSDHQKWSGGEYEKLFLVRTVLSDRPVLLFDEPTNNLDEASRQFFVQVIKRLKKKKVVICVSHDPIILKAADTVIEMHAANGKVLNETE